MTAAPRGIEITNSESNGRKTRYSPPAEEVTVNPSSRPISSSCSRWPLLEKKRLPGSRQKLWRRPLPSTSRTHSPGRSGPRWTPDQCCSLSGGGSLCSATRGTYSPAPAGSVRDRAEGPVDVGGGEDTEDRPVVLDEEI